MSFEARSSSAGLWKKLVDAMKELVTEVNMQCVPEGINIQSMDAAHVALVAMGINCAGFEQYKCESESIIGLNMGNLGKILKTIESNDALTLKHNIEDNVLSVQAENNAGNRSTEFLMKLMEIEAESMDIPDIDYKASIFMSSSEFAKICRDLAVFGDTITVSVNRDGVRFSADGDIGNCSTHYKCETKITTGQNIANEHKAGVAAAVVKKEVKQEAGDDAAPIKTEVKLEPGVKAEAGGDEDNDDVPFAQQHSQRLTQKNKDDADAGEGKKGTKKEDLGVQAFMTEATELSFALRYFTTFSKGAAISDRVSLYLSLEQPCKVEFVIEPIGHLSFFLAPKVEANE